MTRILNVHLLPELANPHDLAGHTSVVVDVLRASTTITTALTNGAGKIIPCLTVEEARQFARDRSGVLLGGERGGKPLEGFDFGNSPAEYTRNRVQGQAIAFTTTNGTRAMTRCMGAYKIVIGSIVNRSAVADAISGDDQIDILCAGTNGEFSMDDALAAGAIADSLALRGEWELNDGARICRRHWLIAYDSSASLDANRSTIESALADSIGGQNLRKIGMHDDVALAADLDVTKLVPTLEKSTWEIT